MVIESWGTPVGDPPEVRVCIQIQLGLPEVQLTSVKMFPPSLSSSSTRQFHSQIILSPCLHPPHLQASNLKLSNNRFPINPTTVSVRWVSTTVHSLHVSPWDDKPHQLLPGGQISYYDEMDVVSFLDPPKQLIPLDPSSYNPAAYLWKKIDDIPEERRHRLLALLNPRLISRAWEVAGTRYDNPKLAKQNSSILFAGEAGPLAVPWINYFKKALFRCEDGQTFGRVIDASVLRGLSHSFAPLYFTVREVNEVMATEQPCDVAYEFGSGLLDIQEYPQGETPMAVERPGCDIRAEYRGWCCGGTSMARRRRPEASS
ncbi:hypothetical protein Ccrd_005059 [Cynara cardunculus var. scolymus]|uniref:Uncharacterized protein n=1 Tax=Cynara cardunculus var. scolymus TaxID=59895 RepID=A0A103XLL1_CYNCS|nr:hypothetical protein Ccrd_005059 [Cynara cardunculus var. scolymus]